MRRILLMAQREFTENARTKSFWIGILLFPVMLGLFIVVPELLERTKSARRYAVLDESGWLSEAVERQITIADLAGALRTAADRQREGKTDTTEIAPVLQPIAGVLTELSGPELAAVATAIVNDTPPTGLADSVAADLAPHRAAVLRWWNSLPASSVKDFAPGSSRERYVRVTPSGAAAESQDSLGRMVGDGELFAYFVIGADPVSGDAGSRYVSKNLTDSDLREWFGNLASTQVQVRRMAQESIDPAVARWIQTPVRFEPRKLSGEGKEETVNANDRLRQWAPVVFVYLLWISIFTVTQQLLTNTIEEKSNRIIEVLLSSVSPVELMAGKIAGIAATGLTIVGSWMLFFVLGTKYLPGLLGAGPNVDLSGLANDPVYIGSFLMYFLLGYLLFAALLVGIGAVCTTLKEAQNLMGPVTIILIVPLMAMIPIGKDPNGTLAQVMSFIPPFTPFVMMNRAAGPPTGLEYLLTAVLLIVSIVAALWAAAKVFRIGILLTGKAPNLKEIIRWIRAPVGLVPQRRQ